MIFKLPPTFTLIRPSALALTLLGLPLALLSSCGGGASNTATGPAPVTQESVVLAAEAVRVSINGFESDQPCTELQDYLATYADTAMRRQLSALRDSPNSPVPMTTDSLAASGAAAAGAQGQTVASASFTTTNLQVSGMDELDTVKNDASHVYRLQLAHNGTSHLSKARYQPADALVAAGQAAVPSHPAPNSLNGPTAQVRGMFLTEDQKVAVLSSHEGSVYALMGDAMIATGAAMAAPSVCAPPVCGAGPSPQTSYVDIFNGAGPGAPVWQAGLEVGGRLIDARRRGNQLWLVTQQSFNFPAGVQWWPTGLGYDASRSVRAGAIDALIAANAAVIRATPLRDWLPADLARAMDGSPAAAAQACRSMAKVSEPTELGWLKIATLNLADRSLSQQTILAQGHMVYASPRAIYVTTPNWRSATQVDPGPRTYLHKFGISPSGTVAYSASGAFAGQPLNPYSLDEDEQGVLRVAADALRTGSSSPGLMNWEPFTYLGRIEQKQDRLTVTSRSLPIAPGERMQSARFVGDRAYLVTFRQVDPFFVYDMNAVGGPKQLGELKIPGFSTYLHPVGEQHILGIGYQDGNWPRRIKASLFDVSDPTNPREQSAVTLGDFYSASDALWNPHAFTYLPRTSQTGLLAIPVWSYRYQSALGESSSIKLLNVSAQLGLSSAGELSVNDVLAAKPSGIEPYALILKRSILTNEHVIGVGDRVLRSATLAQPAQPLSTLLTP